MCTHLDRDSHEILSALRSVQDEYNKKRLKKGTVS